VWIHEPAWHRPSPARHRHISERWQPLATLPYTALKRLNAHTHIYIYTHAEADVWLELNISGWYVVVRVKDPSPSQIRSQASLFHLTPQRSKPKSGFNFCFLSYILLLPSFPYSFRSFSFYHFSLSFLISFFSLFVPVEAQLHYSVAGCMMVRGPPASKIVEVLGFTRCLVKEWIFWVGGAKGRECRADVCPGWEKPTDLFFPENNLLREKSFHSSVWP